jgi:hypothetical protein
MSQGKRGKTVGSAPRGGGKKGADEKATSAARPASQTKGPGKARPSDEPGSGGGPRE